MVNRSETGLAFALRQRFGEEFTLPQDLSGETALATMAARGSTRHFRPDPVEDGLIRTLSAIALSAPTKSDLQQRDIVLIRDPELRVALNSILADQAWIASAPGLLVFCGNNRRQRQIHDWCGHAFANDHLDAFFNAAVDAGIALAAFVAAADAVGLGTCPISAIRNDAEEVSRLLGLPDHVFPVAGLGYGWPKFPTPRISMRLPTAVTVHTDRFNEAGIREAVADYDQRRAEAQPYATERLADRLAAPQDGYGWSEDKARQYSQSERAGFGDFVRAKGFRLD